jgi:hypothetical protein
VIETLEGQNRHATMVMGMGNIAGPGMQIIDYFRRRGQRSRQTLPTIEHCVYQEAA